MSTILALLAGACFSAAYVAPAPYWRIAVVVSMLSVIALRLA